MTTSEQQFHEWFEAVYGRKWDDIKNEEQDVQSLTARMAWDSGFLYGRSEGWKT